MRREQPGDEARNIVGQAGRDQLAFAFSGPGIEQPHERRGGRRLRAPLEQQFVGNYTQ